MKTIWIMTSRKSKKSKSDKGSSDSALRSAMLKQIMPKLSGDRGKELALAFQAGDKKKIRAALLEIVNELTQ